MIEIKKKKKVIKIELKNQDVIIPHIKFEPIQLKFISNCCTLYYNIIQHTMISNIPENIINIQFCSEFNQNILPFLHEYIICIAFGEKYNKDVLNLPSYLENLQFGRCFNQSVSNLPTRLKRLTFGVEFNKPVDYLPNGIKYLTFGHNFNQSVYDLPNSIKFIGFGYNFNQSIDSLSLNKNLEQIVISSSSKFNNDISILPSNIKLVCLPFRYSSKIFLDQDYNFLECIKIGLWYPKENIQNLEKYKNIIMVDNIANNNWITLKKLQKIKNYKITFWR